MYIYELEIGRDSLTRSRRLLSSSGLSHLLHNTLNMTSQEYASMVGGGFYNQFSSGQLRAALQGVPDLADAVLTVAKFKKSKNTADKIIINMADFGSSEGKNSIAVFVETFNRIKDKLDVAIEICVTHTDVPTNDYNELFKHLHTSSYLKGVLPNKIYSMASATSYYEQIFPSHTLDIGFSSTALHWMSCTPCGLTDHVAPNKSNATEVEVWREQARRNWEQILCLRANELSSGGRLVLVVLAVNERGRMNTMFFLDNFNRKLQQMRDAGVITTDEYNAANLPMWFRTKDDVMRAFTEPSSPQVAQQLSQLKVLDVDVRVMPCPYYEQFKLGHVSKDKFARDYVSSCKAWSKPILTSAFKDPQTLDQAYDYVVEQIIKSTEAEFTGDDYVEAYINIEKL